MTNICVVKRNGKHPKIQNLNQAQLFFEDNVKNLFERVRLGCEKWASPQPMVEINDLYPVRLVAY